MWKQKKNYFLIVFLPLWMTMPLYSLLAFSPDKLYVDSCLSLFEMDRGVLTLVT